MNRILIKVYVLKQQVLVEVVIDVAQLGDNLRLLITIRQVR